MLLEVTVFFVFGVS